MFVVFTDASGVSISQPDLIQPRATPPHPSLESPFPLNEPHGSASEASGLADSDEASAASFGDFDLQFDNVFGARRVCEPNLFTLPYYFYF